MERDTSLEQRSAVGATPTASGPRTREGNSDLWYKVYTPEFDKVAYDPLDPPKRYHTGIFVERDTGSLQGEQFHVTGDIIARNGMRFEVKENYVPAASKYFHRTTHIGWIHKDDYPKIRGLDFWSKDPAKRNKLTWTKQNGDLYGPGEERRPIMKCNEWTHELAIPKLRSEGVLHSSI
ncbi:uncharacterized protein N7483_002235 [Penicillium malachiteum]|uniref:uncharacterized protein n=1 Tax=Penicillium malachiteum TaxID=1324776 RepID=UPI002547C899|nr:uncharacterized protein N7483_002235 [Penicillium malachiteum]KAJ5737110.1 hypothetical protein N7483_002235 [Penicillium malachiteum]